MVFYTSFNKKYIDVLAPFKGYGKKEENWETGTQVDHLMPKRERGDTNGSYPNGSSQHLCVCNHGGTHLMLENQCTS